jgi:putative endonuclease
MAIRKTRWHVYLLRCADGTLYTGITTDVERRVKQHNAGTASRYTRSRRPVVLVYRKRVADQSTALRREIAIKKLSRAEKDELVARVRTAKASRPASPRAAGRGAPRR